MCENMSWNFQVQSKSTDSVSCDKMIYFRIDVKTKVIFVVVVGLFFGFFVLFCFFVCVLLFRVMFHHSAKSTSVMQTGSRVQQTQSLCWTEQCQAKRPPAQARNFPAHTTDLHHSSRSQDSVCLSASSLPGLW